jgi:hypothetical protein
MLGRAVVVTCLLAACGGGDDGGGGADAAPGDAGVDAPALRCNNPLVDFELGDLGALEFRAEIEPNGAGGNYVDLFASIAPGPMVDVVSIQLWPGLGAFAGGLAPGTYPIAGVETDFYSCGACAMVVADFDLVNNTFEQQLMASSGTLQIDMVSTTVGQMVTGSLTNARFREVTLNDQTQTQTDVAAGCTTEIDSVSFAATIQDL